jgi:hypothetical protein
MSAIGSVWGVGTWADDVWANNTWANVSTGGAKLRHRRVYEIEEPWNDDDDVFLIIKKIVLSGILDR